MPIHSWQWTREKWRSRFILYAGVSLACCPLPAQVSSSPAQPDAAAAVLAEKVLDPNHVVELAAGERFGVPVPLHVSNMVNLGSAELRIVLASDAPHATTSENVILIAHLGSSQALLPKGNQTLLLYGVVPPLSSDSGGAVHAVDYTIHLGSGSVINLGTPDQQLIDTAALTKSLTGLHLRLVTPPGS